MKLELVHWWWGAITGEMAVRVFGKLDCYPH